MSNVKERIIGAVSIMTEADAEKLWKLILGTFALANATEDIPTEEEIHILNEYRTGNPDFQPFISQEYLLKELDL